MTKSIIKKKIIIVSIFAAITDNEFFVGTFQFLQAICIM